MITYASVFLSHSSTDKALVEAVARELGRRGILAWLDKDELYPGLTLSRAITEAISRQSLVAAFLSPESVKSPWVDDELDIAFQIEKNLRGGNVVVPVCLGKPLELVTASVRLRTRLLHPTGNRINRLYIEPKSLDNPDMMARDIASQLTRSVFARVKVRDHTDVLIYIDQRGNGQRCGVPQDIPPNLQNDVDMPALVFRPDRGMRTQDETLYGQEWVNVRDAMEEGLSEALGTPRWVDPKRIHILGNGQTALFYLLGRHFNRNTSARLYCTNANQPTFSNSVQAPGAMHLQGGNPQCETTHQEITPIAANSKYDTIGLLLSPEQYVAPVRQYLAAKSDASPLVWVKSGWFTDSTQAMAYIGDVVALVSRLRAKQSVRTVYLCNALPVHVVPLLAANLLHEVDNVVFMEYRRDLREKQPPQEETYVVLPF